MKYKILLGAFLIVSLLFIVNCAPETIPEPTGVDIKTDQTVYRQGEPVTVALTNNRDQPIAFSYGGFSNILGMSLFKRSFGRWKYTSLFGDVTCYEEPCLECLEPAPLRIVVQPGETISAQWNQTLRDVACDGQNIRDTKMVYKEPGTYRFVASFIIDQTVFLTASNEFRIERK